MAAATVMSRRVVSKIDTISLDAAISENHSLGNEVTDHPVETGGNVSDHSRPLPDKITMDCVVTDTPLDSEQQARAVQSGGFTFQSTSPTQPSQVPGYADTAYKRLLKLRDEGTLVAVVTKRRTYTSMAIEHVDITDDGKTADALKFKVQLKHVRVVENKLTRTVVAKDKRAGGKAKQGSQTPTQEPVEQSRLAAGYDKAKGKTGVDAVVSFGAGVVGL